MAKSVISGLTVTIGADTKSFTSALKDVEKQARDVAKDLKAVSQSLKIDPGDAQSYSDKMKLLREAVEKASSKVDVIKKAIASLNKEFAEKKVSPEEYQKALEKLERQLESATYEQNLAVNALDQYQRETSDTTKDVDKLGDEQKETNTQISNLASVSTTAGKSVVTLGDLIKGNLISGLIQNGLSAVVNLAKSLAHHLAEAAKDFARFSGEAITMAASYQDALGYSDTIFGNVSQNVKQWVEDNSNALRIYKGDLLESVNTFGQLFQTMGLDAEKSFGMAANILSLAADIRAATGKDINDILESLTAGFTTTTRALRQFGVRISEAEIKAYALDKGIVQVSIDQTKLADKTLKVREATKAAEDALAKYGESSLEYERAQVNVQKAEDDLNKLLEGKVDSLTAAQRTTAIYMMMLEQLDPIIGQNARESGLFNSQLAETKTRMKNLKETIGEQLLPVATDLLTRFNDFLDTEGGKRIIDSLVDNFAKLGDKVLELTENGALENLVNTLIENAPGVIENIGEFLRNLADYAPLVGELVEKLLSLFGIKSEAEETKEAFIGVAASVEDLANKYRIGLDDAVKAVDIYANEMGISSKEVYDNWELHGLLVEARLRSLYETYSEEMGNSLQAITDFARDNGIKISEIFTDWQTYEPQIKTYLESLTGDYNTNTEEIIKAITDYATANGLELADVVSNWSVYEPDILQYYTDMKDETEGLATKIDEEMQKMPDSVQKANEKWKVADISGLQMLKSRIIAVVDAIGKKFDEVFGHDWEVDQNLLDQSTPDWLYGEGAYQDPFRASGGPVRAGRLYRVNDDAGRRSEWFIPSQNGYILNGNQTDRIVNNNNSRSIGTVNMYVNSYGTNVAEVADELGAAFLQRTRMSGARI